MLPMLSVMSYGHSTTSLANFARNLFSISLFHSAVHASDAINLDGVQVCSAGTSVYVSPTVKFSDGVRPVEPTTDFVITSEKSPSVEESQRLKNGGGKNLKTAWGTALVEGGLMVNLLELPEYLF